MQKYFIKGGRIFVYIPYKDRDKAKIIKGHWWHPDIKYWSFPIKVVDKLNETFNLNIMDFKDDKMLKQDKQNIVDYASNYISPIKPYEHQKKVFNLMLNHKKFALLMKMGTGKTKCVVDFLRYTMAEGLVKGALIVIPKSVLVSWKKEFKNHHIDDYVVLFGTKKQCMTKKQRINRLNVNKINIINYEGILVLKDYIGMFNDEKIAVILDESSKIKNPQAKRTKLIIKTFTRNTYKFILSGTPITQNPIDIYPQFKFLNPFYLGFKSWYSFRNRYCIMGGYLNYQIVGYKNLDELKQKIEKHAIILDKNDCIDLPPKVYEQRVLELPKELEKQYNEMKKNLMIEINNDKTITASIILVKLLRLQQITSGHFIDKKYNEKLKTLIDEIKDNINGTTKIVVWCRFIDSIKMIHNELEENGIGSVMFYGETKDREDVINQFIEDNNIKVFVGQLQTGGMGLNLQVADLVYYYENTFSLQDRLQSEDRTHRIGTKNKVTYIDLVYGNTIDTYILKAIEKKENIANTLIQSMKEVLQ